MSYGFSLSSRQDRDDDLDLVAVALPERGPQRPVDQAAVRIAVSDGRPSRRKKLPGILPGRVHPLLDVDREREEVDALAGLGADARGEHLRLAVA